MPFFHPNISGTKKKKISENFHVISSYKSILFWCKVEGNQLVFSKVR